MIRISWYFVAGALAISFLIGLDDARADLSLIVDRTTGDVQITNSPFNIAQVEFDLYQISSPAGSLDPDGWLSLHDQEIDKIGNGPGEQWAEFGAASSQILGEAYFLRSSALLPGQSFSLGTAYDSRVGIDDLSFQYGEVGGNLVNGLVEYVGGPPVALIGDYNDDAIVDALDAGVWAANLGATVPPGSGADGTGDGIVGQDDYVVLAQNLGNSADVLPIDIGPAALIYNRATGNVVLDQSNADGAIVTAFFLNSAGGMLVPGVASFPFPTTVPTQFDGATQIGQIDVSATGLPAVQHSLGAVLPAGLGFAELQSALAGSFYMPAPGFASSPFLIIHIPEPSTLCLATVIGLLASLRRNRRSSAPE